MPAPIGLISNFNFSDSQIFSKYKKTLFFIIIIISNFNFFSFPNISKYKKHVNIYKKYSKFKGRYDLKVDKNKIIN